MILDLQSMFSDDQAITATAISENVIDLGAAGRDISKGVPIPLSMQVTEAFNTLTSLTITVETSAAAGLTSSNVLFTQVVALADLDAIGDKPLIEWMPPANANMLQYLGVRYTVTGTDPTTGKITAGFSMGNQNSFSG